MKCPQCRRYTDKVTPVYNGNPECEICFEKDKTFSIYPCGHLYCSECIDKYEINNDNDDIISIISENEEINNINHIPEMERRIVFQSNGIVSNLAWSWYINEWVLCEYDFDGNIKQGFYQGGSYRNIPKTPRGWHAEWINYTFDRLKRWRLIKNPPNISEIFYFQNKPVHWRLDLEYNRWVLFEQNNELEIWQRCALGDIDNKPIAPYGWFSFWVHRKNVWMIKKSYR